MLPEDVEGEFTDESEVPWGVIGVASGGIFAERDIEHPIELVNPPHIIFLRAGSQPAGLSR